MRVQSLTLSNFKTIKEYAGSFEGGVYLVTGENEIGKSTLINAIGTLLTGNRSDNLLTNGEDKGFAKAIIGEGEDNQYEVSLNFTEKNPRGTLTIQKVGSSLKSDRLSALQEIFNYQDFDANEFVKWSETAEGRRKQIAIVKSLLPDEVQKSIADIDAAIETAKQERAVVSKDIKTYKGLTEKPGVSAAEIKKYAKPLEAKELIDQKVTGATLNEKRANVITRKAERKVTIDEFDTKTAEAKLAKETEISELEAKLEKLKSDLVLYNTNRDTEKKELKDLQTKADTWLEENKEVNLVDLQTQIDNIDKHNIIHSKVKALDTNTKKLAQLIKKEAGYDKTIKDELNSRAELIKDAALPIDGLDFDEDGLTLNGVPFKPGEVSTSQEMEVAAKLIIAKNPTVKVFRIAQGESLGTKRLQAIVDFANKAGYQGFIEEVHRGQDELIIHQYEER